MPELIFNGPDGRLEGRVDPGPKPTSPIALVLHPHPLYGGTMNNKVVFGLYQTFKERGFATMRFNFRGVGRSQGTYDNGIGELADAASALDALQQMFPNANQCWIAGFSFGAWIAMQLLMRRPEIAGFVAVSPPASLFDFNFLAPCPSSGLIIHGGADDLVPEAEVQKLATRLGQQKDIKVEYKKIAAATHFYENHLPEMTSYVGKYVAKALSEQAPA